MIDNKKPVKLYIFLGVALACWFFVIGVSMLTGRLGSSVDPVYNDVIDATIPESQYCYDSDDIWDLPSDINGCIMTFSTDDSLTVAKTCKSLSEQWQKKLILCVTISDKFRDGIYTSLDDWQSPYGLLTVNGNAVGHLLELGAVCDNRALSGSDTMVDFIPYYYRYYGDNNFVPVVIGYGTELSELQNFFNKLADYNDGYKVIFIASDTTSDNITDNLSLIGDEGNLTTLLKRPDIYNLYHYLSAETGLSASLIPEILKNDGYDNIILKQDENQVNPVIFYGK